MKLYFDNHEVLNIASNRVYGAWDLYALG